VAEFIEGIPNFERAFEEMKLRVDEAGRKFVLSGAEVIKREAKKMFITGADAKITESWHSDAWPLPTRRTGNLMNSIYSDGARKTGTGVWESQTGPHIVYGRRIELGFHGSGRWPYYTTRPFPFMQPGIDNSIPQLDILFNSLVIAAQEA
jgi:hypothetical protein